MFLLQHSYEHEVDEGIKVDETKIIGIYSSQKKAEETKEKYMMKKGFNRFSEESFYIDEYEVNQDNWVEGFTTWDAENSSWID